MNTGVRHDDLRRQNRAMVIAAVRRARRASRTELAAGTGLSHSTISAISADLIAEGILTEMREDEAAATRRGRPQVALGLSPGAGSAITVVLGLNSLAVSLIDYSGRPVALDMSRPQTLELTGAELVETVLASVRRMVVRAAAAVSPILQITMAIQGIADADARSLLWSPITPHRDIAFADRLEAELAIPVALQNDCNMIAVALRARAPDRYGSNFIALLLSDGIGMGLVLSGRLFTGSRSSGGEFGHMIHRPGGALCRCGRYGCIEAYAGNYAIFRNAHGLDERTAPAAEIEASAMLTMAAAARASDGPERAAFIRAGKAIGYGLGSLFAIIDPAPIVVVGLGTSGFDVMEPAIRDAISHTAGGQHGEAIDFALELEEAPLIREGCAVQALETVDRDIFAAGPVSPRE